MHRGSAAATIGHRLRRGDPPLISCTLGNVVKISREPDIKAATTNALISLISLAVVAFSYCCQNTHTLTHL